LGKYGLFPQGEETMFQSCVLSVQERVNYSSSKMAARESDVVWRMTSNSRIGLFLAFLRTCFEDLLSRLRPEMETSCIDFMF
jgi:hypothetical protein